MHVKKAGELATQLGLTPGRVSQLRKESWFPKKTSEGWHVDEVRKAIARNSKVNKSRKARKPKSDRKPKVTASQVSEPTAADVEEYLATIQDSGSSVVELSEASMRIAASELAKAFRRGDLGARDYENLKKSLEEYRRTKQSFLDLEEREGRLISKDVAEAMGAALAGQFVRMTDVLRDRLVLQVEIWLGDEEVLDLSESERQTLVGNWVEDQFSSVRTIGADDVDNEIRRQHKDITGEELP